MTRLVAIERVVPVAGTSNPSGRIVWTPAQSIWTLLNGVLGVVGQADPGFWLIMALEALGLVWDVQDPNDQPPRKGLRRI